MHILIIEVTVGVSQPLNETVTKWISLGPYSRKLKLSVSLLLNANVTAGMSPVLIPAIFIHRS